MVDRTLVTLTAAIFRLHYTRERESVSSVEEGLQACSAAQAFPAVTMTRTEEDGTGQTPKAAWSVIVVYEDPAACERAVAFCDQLVNRFWAGFEFDLSWWQFSQLEEANSAHDAASKAAVADVIVFAANGEGGFSWTVKEWTANWLTQRGDREGILVGLLEPASNAGDREGEGHQYLRNVAHHGAMDYLTEVPQDISRPIPDSLDSFTERADQVTHLLDNILHQQTLPPQLLS